MYPPPHVETIRERYLVRVDKYALRSGWVHVTGPSHRQWVVTVDQVILDWLDQNGPAQDIRDGFLHDDYPCYMDFWFEEEGAAANFLAYIVAEWR